MQPDQQAARPNVPDQRHVTKLSQAYHEFKFLELHRVAPSSSDA
jgi:hypothetical protein